MSVAAPPRAVAAVPRFFERIGTAWVSLFEELGRFFLLLVDTARWSVRRPFGVAETMKQMVRVGVDSIPVVFLTAMFTGMVLALQTFTGFQRFHAEGYVGSVVALSMLRELAPVLTALMVSGRAGSAMAAEIGTMRVTEQVDALRALATDPVQYLVVPRVVATVIMMPFLVVMADALGLYGGYLISVNLLGANPVVYVNNTFQFLEIDDLTSGLVKAAFFGLLISVIGCQKGLYTTGGAEGVGRSTTQAVVLSALAILLSDFFLTKILF